MTQSLETALTELEGEAEAAQRALSELAKTLKGVRSAAANGKVSDIEKGLAGSQQQVDLLRERLRLLADVWRFDARQHVESGKYERELLAAIDKEGLNAVSRDGRILCYPSILRVLSTESAVEIDRKKERRLRPSVIAQELKRKQGKKTGIQPEKLMEILYDAYVPLVARQALGTRVVRLLEIHELLTLLPHANDYSKQEFARDLLQLDMSGTRATRGGKKIRFHAATTARAAAVLTAVTPQGEVKIYSSVEFEA